MRRCSIVLVTLFAWFAAWAAIADDAFYSVPLDDLKLTQGELPKPSANGNLGPYLIYTHFVQPYVVLDIPGEAYLPTDRWGFSGTYSAPDSGKALAVRAEAGKEVTGRLYLPKTNSSGMIELKFKIPASDAKANGREKFFSAKIAHYASLLDERAPGGAWFRHRMRQAREQLGKSNTDENENSSFPRMELPDTYDLFTGGRAISENLQLDRALPAARGNQQGADKELVDVATIEELKVPAIDWKPLVKDLKPDLDPLAKLIPADQHVVFFPTFDALTRVADEAELHGTPLLRLAEPQSEDARTVERYQHQLCLSLNGLGRLVGPILVRGVALTGSDLNFRTGTDLAIIFETTQADALEKLLFAQVKIATAGDKQAKETHGEVGGIAFEGSRSPDRTVSCFIAKLEGAVVVTNSLHQLQRLGDVRGGKGATIAGLPEYTFFRDRYRRGDKDEAALVLLSDATIRRWCGPRWRIANSRQLRDLAVLAELQAVQMDKIVAKKIESGPIYTDLPLANTGDLRLTPAGVTSSTEGSLEFLTPLAEIPLKKVTKAEAEAYKQWQRGYETNWPFGFDPIAFRLTVLPDKLGGDLTVMPLIEGTQFREMISYSKGASLKPDSGDPHGALAQVVVAINLKALKTMPNYGIVGQIVKVPNPFDWLGDSISVYADDDPIWDKLAKVDFDRPSEADQKLFYKLPVAVRFAVANPLKATLFLAAVRAYIDQTGPGMLRWESQTYKDKPYLKITATEAAAAAAGEFKDMAIYYALAGDSLTITLSEDVIHHVLDRQLERKAEKPGETEKAGPKTATSKKIRPWLGENSALHVNHKLLDILVTTTRQSAERAMQELAWRNLPILNEWKRLYPDRDPVAVHEQVWKIRLVCPGGGKYAWNDKWQTMESTVYGCPAEPKQGPSLAAALRGVLDADFGLTFEEHGLRARAILDREPSLAAKPAEAKAEAAQSGKK